MKLLSDLTLEHELIDASLGSFRTWAARFERSEAPADDGRAFVSFFRLYAGDFHHEREEEILIPALVKEAQLPEHRGPIAVLLADHREMGALLTRAAELLESGGDAAAVAQTVVAYSHALWHHIDAENTVLFPEAEEQLRRNGVRELPSREPSPEEAAAAERARALLAIYPPIEPDVARGEGCALCPAYGDRCGGVEREWWNQWQWEEFGNHIGSG